MDDEATRGHQWLSRPLARVSTSSPIWVSGPECAVPCEQKGHRTLPDTPCFTRETLPHTPFATMRYGYAEARGTALTCCTIPG